MCSAATGVCVPADQEQGTFDVTGFDGDAAALDSNGFHRIEHGLILSGAGLDGVASVQYFDAAGTALGVAVIAEKAASFVRVSLSAEVEAAAGATPFELHLRVAHVTLGAIDRVATVQRGPRGPRGPTGPTGAVSGTGFVEAAGSSIGLGVGSCTNGQILRVTGGAWTCSSDSGTTSAQVTSIIAGSAVTVTQNGTTWTVGLKEQTVADEANAVAPAVHSHFGQVFSGPSASTGPSAMAALQVVNNGTGVGIEGRNDAGQTGSANYAAVLGEFVPAANNGIGVVGRSQSAQNGVGVQGHARGDFSKGVGAWAQVNNALMVTVAGEANSLATVGVEASNTAGGVALRTIGRSNLMTGATRGVALPLRWRVATVESTSSYIGCDVGVDDAYVRQLPPGEWIAIGGGCYGAAITMSAPVASAADCTSGTLSDGVDAATDVMGTGYKAYRGYCCKSATLVRAEATCLRVR